MEKVTRQTLLDRHGHYLQLYMSRFKGGNKKIIARFPGQVFENSHIGCAITAHDWQNKKDRVESPVVAKE